jgi:hypothetical protein
MFGLLLCDMNFPGIGSWEQADAVAPQLHFLSQQDEERNQRGQRRLAITTANEPAMAAPHP